MSSARQPANLPKMMANTNIKIKKAMLKLKMIQGRDIHTLISIA
jgi:hypothetical protein